MPSANDKRIAKNTLYLYGRMLLTIFVSLYTSRVVLDVLGASDFGIYSVVGGIVVILGFLNGTMSGATSRFISYELGAGDKDKLRRTFSAALTVHAVIALAVVVLAETVGLWYVNHQLDIATERMAAANWVYQFSILASVITIFQIPFVAAIMAHEKMGYYAVVAMVNVFLKLGVALAILFCASADNLIVYAGLIFMAAAIVGAMYMIYAIRRFAECRWSLRNDGAIVKSLLRFTSCDVYGNLCYTMRIQGTLVVLNRFGGTVLNAAGGLCNTVTSTVSSFAGSIIIAFRPQIIQQYARAEYDYMLRLMNNCARYSLLLLGLLIIPMIIAMPQLLQLWLVDVPPYTVAFCRIALAAVCGDLLATIVGVGVHATGRMALYSFVSGTLFLLELPLMWLLLKWTGRPAMVYTVHAAMIFVIVLANTLVLRHLLPAFAVGRFWLRGIATPMAILAATFAATAMLAASWEFTFLQIILMSLLSTAILALLSWFFAIDAAMRRSLAAKVKAQLHLRH